MIRSRIRRWVLGGLLCVGAAVSNAADIGIYFDFSAKMYGHLATFEALNAAGKNAAFFGEMSQAGMQEYDMVVIPCVHAFSVADEPDAAREALRAYVRGGGRALIVHEGIGWRRIWSANPPFPEIGRGSREHTRPYRGPARVREADHPLMKDMPETFRVPYDAVPLAAGEDGKVIAVTAQAHAAAGAPEEGVPVIVAGRFGQGTVVLMGPLVGVAAGNVERAPEGEEKQLLLNAVNWLLAGEAE